jgi:hypothetical protein
VEGKDWDRNSLINHGVGGAKPRVLPRLSVVLFFFSPLVAGQALKEKETKSSSQLDRRWFSSLLFFLTKKSNKKVKAIRWILFRLSKISYNESPVGKII